MTNQNSPAPALLIECPQCGNTLDTADTACGRCGHSPQTTVPDYPAVDMTSSGPSAASRLMSRLHKKRSQVDSPYPDVSEETGISATPRSVPFERPRFFWAAATGVTLLMIAIGSALLFDRDTPDTTLQPQQQVDAQGAVSGNVPNLPVSGGFNKTATIDAASSALAQGNLNAARVQIAMLAKGQDADPAAQSLTARLYQQIQDRDAALAAAHACQQSADTACVLRSASNALANDSASTEARGLLLTALSAQDGRPSVIAATDRQEAPEPIAHAPLRHHHYARRTTIRYSRTLAANDVYARH